MPDCDPSCPCPAPMPRERRRFDLALHLPTFACIACPACLAKLSYVFPAVGAQMLPSEAHHGILLALGSTWALLWSGWRAWRIRRGAAFAVNVAAVSSLAVGHSAGEVAILEGLGVVGLLVGAGLQFRLELAHRSASPGTMLHGAAEVNSGVPELDCADSAPDECQASPLRP